MPNLLTSRSLNRHKSHTELHTLVHKYQLHCISPPIFRDKPFLNNFILSFIGNYTQASRFLASTCIIQGALSSSILLHTQFEHSNNVDICRTHTKHVHVALHLFLGLCYTSKQPILFLFWRSYMRPHKKPRHWKVQ